ncbi:MAG TPA: hypothetical protein VKV74_06990, partial [Bryobacteraceae bacterium]|nr:hypothetical protein [Bryobacteraceae bacterium]
GLRALPETVNRARHQRSMNYKAIGLSLLLIAMPLLAEKFHLDPTQIVPAARGMVDVGHDSNQNTTINLHVEHLARPGTVRQRVVSNEI